MKDLLLVLVLSLIVGAATSLKTDSNLVQTKKLNTSKLYTTAN
ncbi:hypothetical protein C8D79_0276 [Bacteriovorax stolpii]|nr:hypothetical protein [Bacteriovorax stolpii]TDP55231.1 hypothetical protein C8D79_0276 [Bacteriovorax stolpii]BDT29402.1 hypothetical protein BHI3_28680 [Bacteriovorax sp. HI3]